jgi:chlorophyll/bacteriochlorophyll a synthase
MTRLVAPHAGTPARRGIGVAIEALVQRCATTPAWQLFGCAASVAVVRGYADQWSAGRTMAKLDFVLLHAPLSYLLITWSLALVLSAMAKWSLRRAVSLLALGLPVILLVPIIDLAVYGTGSRSAGYFAFSAPFGVAHFIESAAIMLPQPDVTVGQQCVVQLTAIGVGMLVFHVRRRVAAAALAWLAALAVLYFYGALGALVAFASSALSAGAASVLGVVDAAQDAPGLLADFDAVMNAAYLLLIPAHVLLACALRTSNLCQALVANLRAPRLTHYLLMFALGMTLACRDGSVVEMIVFSRTNFLGIALGASMIASLFVAAVWLNDLCDADIDRWSNQDRPYIAGRVGRESLVVLIAAAVVYAGLAAAVLGRESVSLAIVLLVLSFAYSAPPLRLRRWFGVAHLAIGAISTLVVIYPFVLLGVPRDHWPSFAVMSVFMLAVAMLSTAKDLKDAQGDARAGVQTLVTFLPIRAGTIVTAICSGIGAVLLGWAMLGWHPLLGVGAAGGFVAAYIMLACQRADRLLLCLHLAWTLNVLGAMLWQNFVSA